MEMKDLKLEVEELEEKIAPLADSSDVHLQKALVFAI